MSHARRFFVALLAVCLIYSPILAISPKRYIHPAAPATTAPQAITRPHRAGELIVKFKPQAQNWQREQILRAFSKRHKKMRGPNNAERITVKDNLDLATTTPMLEITKQTKKDGTYGNIRLFRNFRIISGSSGIRVVFA